MASFFFCFSLIRVKRINTRIRTEEKEGEITEFRRNFKTAYSLIQNLLYMSARANQYFKIWCVCVCGCAAIGEVKINSTAN